MPASVKEKSPSQVKPQPVNKKKKAASNGKGSLVVDSSQRKKRKKGKIIYPKFDCTLFKKGEDEGPITVETAKKLLGWTDKVPKNVEPLLKDLDDVPIICTYNTDNRPFVPNLAYDWMLEILRGKWRLNGETIIIDRTGMVQDGQHRLIGLILAAQERHKHPEKWSEFWKFEPFVEGLVVTGIMDDDDTVNSIGVSKPRNRTDVVFRSDLLSDIVARKERKQVSSILSYAVKLLWERTAANIGAYRLVPKRSHSGFLDFIAAHPRVEECARFIWETDKPERKIGRYAPLGMSAGMLYLMGASQSDQEEYDQVNSEEAVNWDAWDTAQQFWEELAGGSTTLKPLADKLIATDATGALGNGETLGMLCKAWDLYYSGTPITEEDITVLITTDEYDNPCLAEHPTVGGIDVGKHDNDDEDDS